jgi:hypothetical protein
VDPDAREQSTQVLGAARGPLSVQHAWGRAFQGAAARAHTVIEKRDYVYGLDLGLESECVRAKDNIGGKEKGGK